MRKQLLSSVLTLTLPSWSGPRCPGSKATAPSCHQRSSSNLSPAGATLPAGIYTLDRVTTPSDSHLIIRNRENGALPAPRHFRWSFG